MAKLHRVIYHTWFLRLSFKDKFSHIKDPLPHDKGLVSLQNFSWIFSLSCICRHGWGKFSSLSRWNYWQMLSRIKKMLIFKESIFNCASSPMFLSSPQRQADYSFPPREHFSKTLPPPRQKERVTMHTCAAVWY